LGQHNINLDFETEKIWRENFSYEKWGYQKFSEWVSEQLYKLVNKNLTKEEIQNKVEEIKKKIKSEKEKIELLQNNFKELEDKENEDKNKQEEEKVIRKQKIKQMINNINEHFNLEDAKLIKELAEETIDKNEDVTYLNKVKGIPFKK